MTDFSFLSAFRLESSATDGKILADFIAIPSVAMAGRIVKILLEEKNERMLFIFWQQVTVFFPQWAAARVCYSESLMKYGMIDSAWVTLISTPIRLRQNPKALCMLERIAWVLEYETLHEKICEYRKQYAWIEPELVGLEIGEMQTVDELLKIFRAVFLEDRMLMEFENFCL